MKKLFLGVLMAGSSFWANAQAQVVVAWYYQEWSITQDSLNYKYNTGTNQLQYITDNVLATVSTTDIDNQNPNNYIYDKSGNMVADNSQSMSVSWSPYGKILQTNKAGGANLQFGYNAMQQRVIKRVSQNDDTTRTYYIRDAQGNTMGVYTRHNDSVSWREQYIFGSSRLGLYRADTLVNKGLQRISKLYEGKRNYELTNHLGNVLAVINDRKTDSLSATNVKLGYNAVVISATDYFPFGMAIDSRSYTSSLYRYGFNGKENDKETGEEDYGMRMYDPRNPTFLSIDPIAKKYPELSPYAFASGNPIWAVDLDGMERFIITSQFENGKVNTRAIFKVVRHEGNNNNGFDYAWIGNLPNTPNNNVLRQTYDRCGILISSTTSEKLTSEEINKLSPQVNVTAIKESKSINQNEYNLLVSSVPAPPPPTTTIANNTVNVQNNNNVTNSSNQINFIQGTPQYATAADQNSVAGLLRRNQIPGNANTRIDDHTLSRSQVSTVVNITINTTRQATSNGAQQLMMDRFNLIKNTLQNTYSGIQVRLYAINYGKTEASMGGSPNLINFNVRSNTRTTTTTTITNQQQIVTPCKN